MPNYSNFILSPNVFRSPSPGIPVSFCDEHDIEKHLPEFFESITDGVVGLAPLYLGPTCNFRTLAVASRTRVLVVTLHRLKAKAKAAKPVSDAPEKSLRALLCHSPILKCAFQMDRIAASLYLDFGVYITAAKDLLSLSRGSRHSFQSLMVALGGELTLNKSAAKELYMSEGATNVPFQMLALQAWAAFSSSVVLSTSIQLEVLPSIDTQVMEKRVLRLVATTIHTGTQQMLSKPLRRKNEVVMDSAMHSGEVKVESQRYKTRATRTNGSQHIVVDAVAADGSVNTYSGRTVDVSGRLATISIDGDLRHSNIQSMETVGRDTQSLSESMKSRLMISALQRTIDLDTYPFISRIYLKTNPVWKISPRLDSAPELYYPSKTPLNESQRKAVEAILSHDNGNRVVLVHGPPGTGKTTVIAASVTSTMTPDADEDSESTSTMWLVAQSNVAVKNIAEKLASVGFFGFKILVSKDFHCEWHEHLYEKIEANVIRSDAFDPDLVTTERQLLGSKVILCTLSMLSNDSLDAVTQLVPLQTVIIDEASQIEVSQYLPMIIRFRATLQKLIFVGDDKQLAPYNPTGDAQGVDSIFEVPHLRKRALFLDTQYRMPIPIGDFISGHVYGNQLKSEHAISDPKCCTFIDVADGVEEAQGHSWKNIREVGVALDVAKLLAAAGRSFRIITPYDPQRALLENGLKDAKLPWQDRCFNIDSFQGNEDDYIVISLVRSTALGFLQDNRRINVMLTRCKKGMVLCTSRKFLEGLAAGSLVGKLRKSLSTTAWLDGRQVQSDSVGLAYNLQYPSLGGGPGSTVPQILPQFLL